MSFLRKNNLTHFIHIFRYRPRLSLSILTSIIVAYVLTAQSMRVSQAILLALDAGIVLFLTSTSHYMTTGTPSSMLHKARQQIWGKWFVLCLSIVISAVVIVALYIELHTDKLNPSPIILTAVSIFLAWLFLAFMFALEYAHDFARNGGLIFPETPEPDYWDFVYFSVILNMAFQTADVQITGRHIRRMVLLHSITAFFFNVVIISICINVVAGAV